MSTPAGENAPTLRFADLGLPPAVMAAVDAVGYESPSPIQAATIPALLQGRDVLGQAQTGTGKTAAFALPILADIDLTQSKPQALVLAPTRELAIQVAEAFQKYAAKLPGFHVLPIYGGQSYQPQLSAPARAPAAWIASGQCRQGSAARTRRSCRYRSGPGRGRRGPPTAAGSWRPGSATGSRSQCRPPPP